MARVADGSTVLRQACATAEQTFNRVAQLEDQQASDELREVLTGSPLHPGWLNESDSLLFYQLTKAACLLGVATGEGFLISRLPSEHPSLIKWSAPAFVKIRLASLGLSLGYQAVQSFTVCVSSQMRVALYQQGGRSLAGLEANLSCGGLQHKADLITAPTSKNLKTVGLNSTRGALVDVSFAAGSMSIDDAKNALVYGPGVTPLNILHGGVQPPREMQPLYAALNSVLNTVERVTPPSRVNASLERYSTGCDLDKRIVLKDGRVIKERGGTRQQNLADAY